MAAETNKPGFEVKIALKLMQLMQINAQNILISLKAEIIHPQDYKTKLPFNKSFGCFFF